MEPLGTFEPKRRLQMNRVSTLVRNVSGGSQHVDPSLKLLEAKGSTLLTDILVTNATYLSNRSSFAAL